MLSEINHKLAEDYHSDYELFDLGYRKLLLDKDSSNNNPFRIHQPSLCIYESQDERHNKRENTATSSQAMLNLQHDFQKLFLSAISKPISLAFPPPNWRVCE